MTETDFETLWLLICRLAEADGAAPLCEIPGCWECRIDDSWEIAVNGHEKIVDGIRPFTATVRYNGFPAGLFDPSSGVIAAGRCANAATLAAAIERKLESLGGGKAEGEAC